MQLATTTGDFIVQKGRRGLFGKSLPAPCGAGILHNRPRDSPGPGGDYAYQKKECSDSQVSASRRAAGTSPPGIIPAQRPQPVQRLTRSL